MAIKRTALHEREVATIHIDFGDAGDLNVEFYPTKLTYGLRKRIAAAAQAEDYDAMLEGFIQVFKSWDLLDDKGKPEPLEMAVLADLGEDVLAEIMKAIQDATSPKSQTDDSSPDGSAIP